MYKLRKCSKTKDTYKHIFKPECSAVIIIETIKHQEVEYSKQENRLAKLHTRPFEFRLEQQNRIDEEVELTIV